MLGNYPVPTPFVNGSGPPFRSAVFHNLQEAKIYELDQAALVAGRSWASGRPYKVGDVIYHASSKLAYMCLAATNSIEPDYSNPLIEGVTWSWVLGSITGYVAGRGWWKKTPDKRMTQNGLVTPETNNNNGIIWTYPIQFASVISVHAQAQGVASSALGSSFVTEVGTPGLGSVVVKVLLHGPSSIFDVTNKAISIEVTGVAI